MYQKWKNAPLLYWWVLLHWGVLPQVQRNVATKRDSAEMSMPDETMNEDNALSKKENRREMIRSLNLSKEQKQKFKEIHQANKAKKESIESNGQLTESQKKDQVKELHKEAAINMNNVLSEEQRRKVKEMRKPKRG